MAAGETDPHGDGSMGSAPSQGIFMGGLAIGLLVLMALFVVVVGPVDYFLLGMFRLRKLTWALFPIVALVFAWFTVALSNSYMQTSEQSGSLVLLDVGDRGQIVRENELKLYFANTSRSRTRSCDRPR